MRAALVPSLLLALVAGACGAGATPAPGPRTIEITMTDLKFTPATITLTAGETVTLRFRNEGKLDHEFMAGLRPTGGKGFAEDWVSAVATDIPPHTHPGEEHSGEGVRVGPDWYGSLTVTPKEKGEYDFGCFVPGHWEAGMKGKIVVR